jgi:hypothetical protein
LNFLGFGRLNYVLLSHIVMLLSLFLRVGAPKAVRTEHQLLDSNATLNTVVTDGQHVWVVLKGLRIFLFMNNKRGTKTKNHCSVLLTVGVFRSDEDFRPAAAAASGSDA